MGGEEIVATAAAGIHVGHHHEETGVLQVEVGIDVHDGVVANFLLCFAFLHAELSEGRAVVGGCIFREVAGIGTEVDAEHAGNLEAHEEIGVDVQIGNGKHIAIRSLLIGEQGILVQRNYDEVMRYLGVAHAA